MSSSEAAAEWVAIDQLKEWGRNPRLIDEAQIQRVAESIKRFGFSAPIVARLEDGEIIAGHTRYKAARKLGLHKVPVRFMQLDPADAHLLALADNRLTELTPWNDAELYDLLGEFGLESAALAGWSSEDLEQMGSDLLKGDGTGTGDGKPSDVDEDEPGDPPPEPITKPGDLWLLGKHRLLCADATKRASYERLLEGTRAHLMVTDPPYGVSVTGGTHDPRDPNYRKGPDRKTIANDSITGEKLRDFLKAAFTEAGACMVPGASWYVWYAGTETRAFIDAAELLGGFRHILMWVKPNFVFGRCDYHYRHEPCLYGWLPGAGHTWRGSRDQSSVFELSRDGAVAELKHPTVKPVKLYSVPIENHLEPGQIVLDPFSGSGPAFSAAEQTGRICYGTELDPAFCDVIVDRWERLTGAKAERRRA